MTKAYFTDICEKNAKKLIDSFTLLLDRNKTSPAEKAIALQTECLRELAEIKYLLRNLVNLHPSFSSEESEEKRAQ